MYDFLTISSKEVAVDPQITEKLTSYAAQFPEAAAAIERVLPKKFTADLSA